MISFISYSYSYHIIIYEEQFSYISANLKRPHIDGAEVKRIKHVIDI